MDKQIEKEIAQYLMMMFGDLVEEIIRIQKRRLGLNGKDELNYDDYILIANEIKKVSTMLAGETAAVKVYEGLIHLIKEKYKQ